MNLKFTGGLAHIRILSHQLTGHVVWYTVDPSVANPGPKYVPTCCPDLDYVTYTGPAPTSYVDFRDLVKQYRLVHSISDNKFVEDTLAEEFREHLKLERAKCYSMHTLNNTCHWVAEKNGLVNNLWFTPLLEPERVIEIVAAQQSIAYQDAANLYTFKREEYVNEMRKLHYAQLEAELATINAKTVEEVLEIFKTTSILLGRTRASTAPLTNIL